MRMVLGAFAVAAGLGLSAASPAFAQPPQRVTLAQAVAIAAAQSPVLQAARDDYRLAELNVDFERTPLAPSVAGLVTVQRSQTAVGGTSSTALQGELKHLVYDGGRVLARVRSARFSQDAAGGTYRRAAQLLTFTVAQAYYGALEARATVQLARQIVKQDQTQEALIRAQIQAGTASRLDQATAHLPTAQALVQLARAQGQQSATQAAFDNVLGLRADAGAEPVDDPAAGTANSLIPAGTLDVATAITRALALRPDYRAGERTIDAARESVRAARLARSPQISGSAGLGATSSGFAGGSGLSGVGTIGATISIPLFDQGITRVQSAQAVVQLDRAQAVSRQNELAVELDVRQALATLISARTALTEAQAELSGAQTVLAGTQEQYRAGVTTLPLLLNAQAGLTLAENERLSAIYALRRAEQNYLFALGDI
jgi:outer membrane protein